MFGPAGYDCRTPSAVSALVPHPQAGEGKQVPLAIGMLDSATRETQLAAMKVAIRGRISLRHLRPLKMP